MAKKKLSKWDAQHMKNLASVQRDIDDLFRQLADEAARPASIVHPEGDKPFSFDDYPITRQRADLLLARMQQGVNAVVVSGIDAAWQLSADKMDETVMRILGQEIIDSLTEEQRSRYLNNNEEAREAFKTRREAGLNLSDRV